MFPDLKSGPLLEDLAAGFGVAVFSEVEQTCCDIPITDSSNNHISMVSYTLHQISHSCIVDIEMIMLYVILIFVIPRIYDVRKLSYKIRPDYI